MRNPASPLLCLLFAPVIALSVACGDDTVSDGGSNPGGNGGEGGTNEGGTGASTDGGGGTGGAPQGGGGNGGEAQGGGGEGGTGGGEVGVAPTITGPSSPLPDLSAGTAAQDVTFTATGDAPISWSVTNGALPDGMTLDEASGLYSGTPSAPGEFTFTITATNDTGTDDQVYTQVVELPDFDAHVLRAGQIAAFSTTYPQNVSADRAITGLAAGQVLETIDRRPTNGWLYGMARDAQTGAVQLYVVHPASGAVTPLGTPVTFVANGNPVVNTGTLEMDFNPTVDRVRVVTSTGLNFRMNPTNGAGVDGDPNTMGIQMDPAINGEATAVDAAAYTNNQNEIGGVTTLYTVSANNDELYIQNPANGGVQTLPVALSDVIDAVHGLDISHAVTTSGNNMPVTAGSAFGVFTIGGQDRSVQVDLVSGALTLRPAPGTGSLGVALQQPPSAPSFALTSQGQLLRFNAGSPQTTTASTLLNVAAGETIVDIDLRPATGQLYGLGINPLMDTGTVYLIEPTTGAATPIGAIGSIAFANTELPASGWAIDFNPTVDRLRVVNANGLNFRVNQLTGAAVDSDANPNNGTTPDGQLSTSLTAVGYTNSAGQAFTSLYALDAATNALYLSSSPNAGTYASVVGVSLNGSALDFGGNTGLDIQVHVETAMSNMPVAAGVAYASLEVGGSVHLYTIDLLTGAATDLGTIGAGNVAILGITIGQSQAD